MSWCSSRLLEHFRRQQAPSRWASRGLCQQLCVFLSGEASRTSLVSMWQHLYVGPSANASRPMLFCVLAPAVPC